MDVVHRARQFCLKVHRTSVTQAAQTQAFFENADQMAIPHATMVQLANEGIDVVQDLVDFDKDTLQQVADNLRRPGGRMPDPDPNAAAGATIPTPPFAFGAKSHKRLLAACDLVRYYTAVGGDLTPSNIRWNPAIKNFATQWKALVERKKEDDVEVPKTSKALPIVKWTEAFDDYLHQKMGARTIPLAYVTREDVTPPAAAPPLATDMPHSTEHGSVEAELVARASHLRDHWCVCHRLNSHNFVESSNICPLKYHGLILYMNSLQ